MINEFLRSVSRHADKFTSSPRELVQRVSEETGMEVEDVKDIFETPEKAEAFLGRRYLRLSSMLADNLEAAIQEGEISPSETVRAIPVVAKTARLFLGESTLTVSEPMQALLEALEEGGEDATTSDN